ncbi:MAG: DUF5058 family protein [Firmicutes bacterium]|nr:DUF5058 family protein [Bacillota bacterium]
MTQEYLSVANSPVLWLASAPLVIMVFVQAALFSKRAIDTAQKMGISGSSCLKAMRAGMVTAIGPAVAALIMMVGMMSVLGAPISWQRLSVVCAAAGELIHAGLGAQAMGTALGAPDFGLKAYSAAVWAMAFFSVAWIPVLVFTPYMKQAQSRIEKYDPNIMALITTAAMLGITSFMTVQNSLQGSPYIVAAVSAGLASLGFARLVQTGPQWAWLKEYNMGLAMIVGMVCAAIWTSLS